MAADARGAVRAGAGHSEVRAFPVETVETVVDNQSASYLYDV
jgi:hypothetical protein